MPCSDRAAAKATSQGHGMVLAWARNGMYELTSTGSRRPVGDLPSFGFLWLARGHSRRLLTRMLLSFRTCLICSEDDGDNGLCRIVPFSESILKLNPAFLLLLYYVSIVRSFFVCGQQLFQVFKFQNTHSKIFEKYLPFIFQTSKLNVKFSYLFACSRRIMNPVFSFRGAAKGGVAGMQPPQTHKTEIKTTQVFLGIVISKVLCDFPFSRNKPLKSADDCYIRILKNIRKLVKLKNKKVGHCD
jgi:predicted RNA-binding protein YlxR (DUF448 family)